MGPFAAFRKAYAAVFAKWTKLEESFDSVMQSFEERYTRGMKTAALVISFLVVVFLNANFFNVYTEISTSDAKRELIIQSRPEERVVVPTSAVVREDNRDYVFVRTSDTNYQLTPVKDRCLARCRSPLGFVLRYGSYRGRSRDVRVGVNHGGFCLACCWALMAVLLVAGLMNVVAMVVVVAVVVVEKTWRWGPTFGRVVGVVAFVLAVAVVFRPTLAAGLHQPTQMGADMSTHGS